ncbi:hypothetical protein X752_04375 [Mesorhizobium sp. LNJC398B00]|nr:hypothetical protein X752_04375 [Mesorhizobium sp. LNJC398B00]
MVELALVDGFPLVVALAIVASIFDLPRQRAQSGSGFAWFLSPGSPLARAL